MTLEQLGNQDIYNQTVNDVNEHILPQINSLRPLLATVRHGQQRKKKKGGGRVL